MTELARQWHQYPEGDSCPGCGKDALERDAADIGVGVLFGPWHCVACGWSEPAEDYGLVEGECDGL